MVGRKLSPNAVAHPVERSHVSRHSQGNPQHQSKDRSQASLRVDARGPERWTTGLLSPLPTPPIQPNPLPHEFPPPLFPFYSTPSFHHPTESTMTSPRSRATSTSFHSVPDSTTVIPSRDNSRSISPSAAVSPANTFLTDQGLFIRRRSNQRIAKIDWSELEGWLSEIVQETHHTHSGKGTMRLANGHPWRARTKQDSRRFFILALRTCADTESTTEGHTFRPPFKAITTLPKLKIDPIAPQETHRRIPSIPSPPSSIEYSPPTPSFRVLLPHIEPRPSLPRKRTREDVAEALNEAGLTTKGTLFEGEKRQFRLEEDKRRRLAWESLRGGIESNLRNSPEEEEIAEAATEVGTEGGMGLGMIVEEPATLIVMA